MDITQTILLARRKEIFGLLLARKFLFIPTPYFSGFSLFRSWMRPPFPGKFRTIGGTIVRLVQRGPWRRQPAFLKRMQ